MPSLAPGHSLSPLRGSNGCPPGSYFNARPPPGRGRKKQRPRPRPLPAFATRRSVVRGLRRSLPLSGRSRQSAAESRRGGRWTLPAASPPSLRFGHPAHPPIGHLLFSALCTFVDASLSFFVAVCLAAVTFAFTFGTVADACQEAVTAAAVCQKAAAEAAEAAADACQDLVPEHQRKCCALRIQFLKK